MYFTGIIGDPGSGKTSLLTAELHEWYLKGYPIVANYRLEFPHTYMPFNELINVRDPRLRRAKVGMDELGTGADSYEFLSGQARGLTKTVAGARKLDMQVYYSVHRRSWLTLRLRQISNNYVFMEDLDAKRVDHTKENCEQIYLCTFTDEDFNIYQHAKFNGRPYNHMFDTNFIPD